MAGTPSSRSEGDDVQDRYVGDVGDFGKYGLLKALCGADLSLGVVWYLYPDEEDNGDGGHVGYLRPTPQNLRRFRDCDPDLYDDLGELVGNGSGACRALANAGYCPRARSTTRSRCPLGR